MLDQPPSSPRKPYTQTREMGGQHASSPASLKRRKSLTNVKGKDKAAKKTRSRMTKDYKEKVQDAQKKERLRSRKTQGPSWIYVGNIKSVFRNCGRILDVSCRVTRGTTGAQSKHWHRSLKDQDRGYAAVQFADQISPLKAHRLDGTVLNGLPIMVCYNAHDLPDAREITREDRERPEVQDRAPPGFLGPVVEGLWCILEFIQ
ncbi:hypothetical protein NEOLEDRAFT_1146829 [Neolentinus lepideus HHB14362 ss-1]|uniref:RRM domain-containing protein n=1 Tax=Neolentinus lepideus HHB14362 ss-1 TaxID=1314782 RepID=A0A165TN45_9AGAM|nr:hypothetical protein NEOLEDRAFT_1146829 [Neolentinus lepideus HHB14362 ss-1]